jgi:hypothetical protein
MGGMGHLGEVGGKNLKPSCLPTSAAACGRIRQGMGGWGERVGMRVLGHANGKDGSGGGEGS